MRKTEKTVGRRPGPFGPAMELIPLDQHALVIEADTPAYDAIERMKDDNYSQLPVRGGEGKIIGVFSWRAFALRAADLRDAGVDPGTLPVQAFLNEPVDKWLDHEPAPTYVHAGAHVDRGADWNTQDYVLVGDNKELRGIVSVSDVLASLHDFTRRFILIHDVELEIRDLIKEAVSVETLKEMISGLNMPKGMLPPSSIDEASFFHYRELISSRKNWPVFEHVFDQERKRVDEDLKQIASLRNDIFHFRREIKRRELDDLEGYRDRLRYNRELMRSRREEAPVPPQQTEPGRAQAETVAPSNLECMETKVNIFRATKE